MRDVEVINAGVAKEILKKVADSIEKGQCIECKQEFSDKNVFTMDGLKETQLSGMCEKCFDEAFGDEEDGDFFFAKLFKGKNLGV